MQQAGLQPAGVAPTPPAPAQLPPLPPLAPQLTQQQHQQQQVLQQHGSSTPFTGGTPSAQAQQATPASAAAATPTAQMPVPGAAAATPAASGSTGAPPPSGTTATAAERAAAAADPGVRMKHVMKDNGVLNLGGGVMFQIPLWYDDLAKTGGVPRLEEVAMIPADLLRQPQALQQNAAALSDAARSRAMLRGRYRAAGKDYLAAVPVLDSRQRMEQLQRLHHLQQQQQEAAAAAAAAAGGLAQPQTQAAADAVASTLSAVLRRQLQPAPQYETAGTVHWSLLQYREAVQQAEEAAAAAATAAAAAAAASKKRSAAAAGLGDRGLVGGLGGSSGKRFALADFGLAGSAAGEQWWYLPGTASEAEQARRSRRPAHADPAQQAAWEDAALAAAWVNMVRRDIPRAARYAAAQRTGVMQEASRLADACVKDLKLKGARAARDAGRGASTALKRLLRDGQAWWRAAGREAVGSARAAARAAVEAARREEEAREAKRQQQRLNFLLTQTELYSHFMKNKKGDAAVGATPPSAKKTAAGRESSASPFPAVGAVGVQGPSGLGFSGLPTGIKPLELADSEAEAAALAEAAAAKAAAAAANTLGAAAAFDQEYAAGAAAVGAALPDAAGAVPGSSQGAGEDEVNLTQPTTMPEDSGVVQPSGFRGSLKGYQLKGLQWLSSLYDQGLNGILADEMGLGKTVQALAFMAHLAEARGVWGPFLVVAPASTLHNWDRELQQFTPGFKVLPYWGTLADRKTLRRLLTPSRLYGRAAPFHVCLTSYQMAVADEAVLKKVKWQFMILDEAQAIKSSSSSRWRVLLSFGCRNRLLLSGTPIQNNLQELWALLHFIMPQLFDSREAFTEWFARGNAGPGGTASASSQGPNMSLDKHQLARLHAVLGPFMLRRVKADVIAEMVPKTEVTLRCPLSRRQAELYAALRKNLTLQDLVAMNSKMAAAVAAAGGGAGAAAPPAATSSSTASARLMGLIMQMRKVCNHPELFEGQAERWPLQFAESTTAIDDALKPVTQVVHAGPGRPPKAPTATTWVQVTGFRSHIQVVMPQLLYREGLLGLSPYVLGGHLGGTEQLWLQQRLFVFQAANTYSLTQQQQQQQVAGHQHQLQKGQLAIKQQQQAEVTNGQLQQQQQQPWQHLSSSNGNNSHNASGSSGGSSTAEVLVIPQEPCCYPSGLGFISLCGLSPSEVWALAAGDPFQVWEISSGSSKGAAAAAAARQQRWQDYSISEQQWRQHILQLRKQLSQRQQKQDQLHDQQQQQHVPLCPVLGPMRELHSTQHSMAQQQLLSLPPNTAALLCGRSRRTSRLLLCVDDIASGHSAAAAGFSTRGRGLRRPRAAWSPEDRQLLLQIQQQQQQPTGELGELLPPLVLSSSKRLRMLSGLLRSVWGALIPPVLSPGVELTCRSIGVMAQQQSLVDAPWSRALLLGIDSTHSPPTFPAGTPPVLVAAATWRVAAAAAAMQPSRQPLVPESIAGTAAAAAAAAGDGSSDEEGTGGRGSEAGDDSAAGLRTPGLGAGFSKGRLNPSPDARATPPLPPSTGRGRGRGRRGRGRGRGRWANRDSVGLTPSSSKVGDGEEGGIEAGSVVVQQRRQYCYVLDRQQAALPGYCRDAPPPVADLEAAAAGTAAAAAAAAGGGGDATAAAAAVGDALAFAAGLSTPSPPAAAAATVAGTSRQGTLGSSHTPAAAAGTPAAQQTFPLVVRTQQPPISVSLPPPLPSIPQPMLAYEAFAASAQQGLASSLFRVFGAAPPSQPYALAKALNDSGKLMALDGLLNRLKVEGHRCLIFCQMTTMMDLLEDYLSFRRHRYLRLDGSTPIAERRDLVDAWQGSDTYFVFLLSTRAGGLGINLTAADTVIFYESDWNPTMDLQAMDRAHRLGQTRPVTVYRLITAGTIEERIQSTAAAKTHVQRQVMAEETAAAGAAEGSGARRTPTPGEGEEEEGSEGAVLVPGSVPEGMLLDELEDEETAAAAALGGEGAAAAAGASGAAAGSSRGLFVDDVPSALGAADVASLLLDDDLAAEAAKQGLDIKELATPQKQKRSAGDGAGPSGQQQQGLEGGQEGSAPQQALGVRFLGAVDPAVAAVAAAGEGVAMAPATSFIGGLGAGAQLPPLPPAAAGVGGVGTPATSFKRRGTGRPPGVPGRGGGGRGSRGGRLGRPPGPGRRGRGRRGGGAGAEGIGDGWTG